MYRRSYDLEAALTYEQFSSHDNEKNKRCQNRVAGKDHWTFSDGIGRRKIEEIVVK